LQVHGPDRVGVKLDYGRHLRAAYERAKQRGEPLTVAVCVGADLALHFTAATMGSQMPEHADELAVAGGLCGRPLSVIRAVSQDLLVPAEAEFILEGQMLADQEEPEGPFGEFIGFAAPAAPAPVLKVSAVTHRSKPIYHAINGYGRETVVLRKYVLEASLLKVLRASVPIVKDAEMTAGGLHRFHAIIQVEKKSSQHDGLQRNAILAAFGALKDLDLVIVVDEDIDIRDPHDVEYALATRMEASRDLILVPGARGHEYVRAGNNGIRTKLGIDASVPFAEKERFRRVEFLPLDEPARLFVSDRAAGDALFGVGDSGPE
jgi:2,5-furandicarboxylate decarboxylase 1